MTSNRHPDEWLATFADPMRAQSALDRFKSNAYDLEMEGESTACPFAPEVDHPCARDVDHPVAVEVDHPFAREVDQAFAAKLTTRLQVVHGESKES